MKRKKKKAQVILSREHKNLNYKNRKLALLEYFPLSARDGRWIYFVTYTKGLINSIESVAFRRYMRKKTKKRKIEFSVRFFPNIKLTKKSLGVRMGGGKGSKVYSMVKPICRGALLAVVRRPSKSRAKKLLLRYRRKFSLFLRKRRLSLVNVHNKMALPKLHYFKSNKFINTGKFESNIF